MNGHMALINSGVSDVNYSVQQSSRVKRPPAPPPPPIFLNEMIFGKVNPLVVVDFRFISAFLHA